MRGCRSLGICTGGTPALRPFAPPGHGDLRAGLRPVNSTPGMVGEGAQKRAEIEGERPQNGRFLPRVGHFETGRLPGGLLLSIT